MRSYSVHPLCPLCHSGVNGICKRSPQGFLLVQVQADNKMKLGIEQATLPDLFYLKVCVEPSYLV
jgi:hypothetical protein